MLIDLGQNLANIVNELAKFGHFGSKLQTVGRIWPTPTKHEPTSVKFGGIWGESPLPKQLFDNRRYPGGARLSPHKEVDQLTRVAWESC